MIAMAVGAALALLALGYVLYPLLAETKPGDESQPVPTCPKCETLTKRGARFCSNCGEPLTRPEENDRLGRLSEALGFGLIDWPPVDG